MAVARWSAALSSISEEQLPVHTPSETQEFYLLMFKSTCNLSFNEHTSFPEKVSASAVTALLQTDFW